MYDLPKPLLGDELPAHRKAPDMLSLLATRRSTTAAMMDEPGPSAAELRTMLQLAARVPDHRKMVPFRFLTITGDARQDYGRLLTEAASRRADDTDVPPADRAGELAMRSPTIVVVVSRIDHDHKTPEWEQTLTAGAVCQNLLLAASASGFAAQWITEWIAYDPAVTSGLGLAANERVAGIVHIGTAAEAPKERQRPDMDAITEAWPRS